MVFGAGNLYVQLDHIFGDFIHRNGVCGKVYKFVWLPFNFFEYNIITGFVSLPMEACIPT